MSIVDVKVLLGIVFFAVSCVTFVTMLHLLGSPHTTHAKSLRGIHRLTGGITVAFFIAVSVMCIMLYIRGGGELSPRGAIHFTFAALFIPLILLKILIVEKYPELRNRLLAVGTGLFTVTFLIFFTSSAFHLMRGSEFAQSLPEAEEETMWEEKQLFVVKCAKCHRLDRTFSAVKTPTQWKETVEEMRLKDPGWISEQEAEEITEFLISLER